MERWAIELLKENLKFSAAHFLIFPDGSAERLHGHNYRVFVEVGASLGSCGLVIDFTRIKPIVKTLVDRLQEHWLIPGEHPELRAELRADGVVEVRYRERYYAAPEEDVVILPLNNISTENLAAWLGRELRKLIEEAFPDVLVENLRLAVEETLGQRGVYYYTRD